MNVSSSTLFDFLVEPATAQSAPSEIIYDDKPEYTRILMLAVEGFPNSRIAADTGYSVAHVCLIRRQIWFKQKYRQLIALSGAERIQKLYTNTLEDNLDKLIELSETSKSDAVKLQALIYMTDRVIGKPVQQIVTEKKPVFDLENINEELDAIKREKEELERAINHATPLLN